MKRSVLSFSSTLLSLFTAYLLSATAQAAPVLINGAGATFPQPIYSRWFSDFAVKDKSVQINYQAIGSGGGIRQLIEQTVDFGASDAPMLDTETAELKTPVHHLPMVLGAVSLSYNLPGVDALNLDSEVLADIFLGKILQWKDAKIQKLNSGAKLPALDIVVAYRSDGSGTTSVFTDYMAAVSPEWKEKVGAGKSVKWPTGIGAKGNAGVAGIIKQSPGSIGYIEVVFAIENGLKMAALKNKSGKFVAPNLASVSAAAAGRTQEMIKNDFKISLVNSTNASAYPIASFTWLLVSKQMPKEKGTKLVGFLNWAMRSEAQDIAAKMNYAPLPQELRKAILGEIKQITLK